MTRIDKYMEMHPEKNKSRVVRLYCCCDELFDLLEEPEYCVGSNENGRCADCWNRHIPGTEEETAKGESTMPKKVVRECRECRHFEIDFDDGGICFSCKKGKYSKIHFFVDACCKFEEEKEEAENAAD